MCSVSPQLSCVGIVPGRVTTQPLPPRAHPPHPRSRPPGLPAATKPRSCSPVASSVAHGFPWEVLLAVCEQADEPTLVRLCLVSFGMLELAGPVLYRHVELATAKRLYGFFIKPSAVCWASRIRPFLGHHLVRTIRIDFRPMSARSLKALLPPKVWSLPNRRAESRLSVEFCEITSLNFQGPKVDQAAVQVRRSLAPAKEACRVFTRSRRDDYRKWTVDVEFTWIEGRALNRTMRTRYRGDNLFGYAPRLRAFLDAGFPKPPSPHKHFRMAVDLRRVTPYLSFLTACAEVRALATACLESEPFWRLRPYCSIDFLVASDAVAQLVEETIAASIWHARKRRCRVIKS